MNLQIRKRLLEREITFNFSRSSGPGGQNVNKVNSKVELRFSVQNSSLLSDKEKKLISDKLKHKINQEGQLIIVAQNDRSQLKNKEAAINKFYQFLSDALKRVKSRKATKPTRNSNEKRIERKKARSRVKEQRGKIKY